MRRLLVLAALALGVTNCASTIPTPKMVMGMGVENGKNFAFTGTTFAYRGYYITAGHVCAGVTSLLILNPETRQYKSHKILQNFDKEADVCILSKTDEEGFSGANTHADKVTACGFGHQKYQCHELTYETTLIMQVQGTAMQPLDQYYGHIVPGMSGGPAFDKDGKLAGLNSAGDDDHISLLVSVFIIDKLINKYESGK